MIEGIVTGYEERFDFPERSQLPSLAYMLASTPRSGSTYLSHVLWASGCLGAPLEYLNFEPGGPYGFAHGNRNAQIALWRRALIRRTSANGVFGIKAFPGMLHGLQGENPALVNEVMRFLVGPQSSRKIIDLRRRDQVAHAISYARALLSGIWRAEQEEGGRDEPEYSAIAVERAAAMIEQQEQGWQAMYRDIGVQPLVLYFEDVLADPVGVVKQVGQFLGISIDPAAAVDVPEIRQQSRVGAKDWAAHHKVR